jgi:hypothetical protein
MNSVFFASPGRSGTMYFCGFLQKALPQGWIVRHEPHADLKGNSTLVFKRDRALRDLYEYLEFREAKGYVETGLQFINILVPHVLQHFPNFRMVHVMRDCLSNALSLHGASRPLQNPIWFLEPSEGDEIKLYASSLYMRWLWECYECHARALRIKEVIGPDRYYFFPFKFMSNREELNKLARWIDPEATPEDVIVDSRWMNSHAHGPVEVTFCYTDEYEKWYSILSQKDKVKVDAVNNLLRAEVT